MKGRKELLREILREEARLAVLQVEAEECAARLATLRDRMSAEQLAQDYASPEFFLEFNSIGDYGFTAYVDFQMNNGVINQNDLCGLIFILIATVMGGRI